MIPPLYISFEGIDGCGKTTQIDLVKNHLRSHDIPVFKTKHPTERARHLRNAIVEETSLTSKAKWFLEEFVGDIRRNTKEVIEPRLAQGINVLCDRAGMSTRFYHHLQGISMEDIEKELEGIRMPDYHVIFDCPVDVALERIKKRSTKKELFHGKDFLEDLRNLYLYSATKYFDNKRILIVDGSKPQEIVFRNTIFALESIPGLGF